MIRTRSLLLPRGRYSSMLDMGGVASADANAKIDTGKNLKIRAIALDFNVISRAAAAQRQAIENARTLNDSISGRVGEDLTSKITSKESIQPNVGIVQNLADLLGISLGGDTRELQNRGGESDDLSRLTRTTNKKRDARDNLTDVRVKYAKKLRSRVEGGLAGLELAKSQREETSKRGDAPAHLAARSIARSQVVSSASMWLAKTGTGTLLTFLNNRSMKIILMPLPTLMDAREKEKEGEQMENFERQLGIKFDLLMKGLEDSNVPIGKTTDAILDNILASIVVPPISTIVVSNRDDYLLSAKNRGMFTCRVRPKNAPRGNVTTSYNVADIDEIEEVINQANGISFSAVSSRGYQ